jgi:hypothetical protein
MTDAHLPTYLLTLLESPTTDNQLLTTVYSLLTALLRDEPDYKLMIGYPLLQALMTKLSDVRALKVVAVLLTRCRENV